MIGDHLRVVAVESHSDDIGRRMAGLLVRFKKAGHRETWIVATHGGAGGGGRGRALAEIRLRKSAVGGARGSTGSTVEFG